MNRIKQLVDEDRILKINESKDRVYYVVKGTSRRIYEVIYDKIGKKFHCTCNNIRLTNCYHIKAVQLFMTLTER